MLEHVSLSTTPRSTITRIRERARTDRADLYAVLDAGLVCHLGLVRDGAPVVLPTGYGRIGDTVYLHGSTGAGYLRMIDGGPVCLTVTHLDGIVYARSTFHHSMNYRSAVVHGRAQLVADQDERWAALRRDRRAARPGLLDARPPARPPRARGHLGVRARPGRGQRQGPNRAAGRRREGHRRWPRWAGVLPIHTVLGEPAAGSDPAGRRTGPRAHPRPTPVT